MNKHENAKRGFFQYSRAWYATSPSSYNDEVTIGIYFDEGGTAGEFAVRWEQLGNVSTPRLMVCDGAWDVLSLFQDMLQEMKQLDSKNVPPNEFCDMLRRLGIEDMTPMRSEHNQPQYICEVQSNLGLTCKPIDNDKWVVCSPTGVTLFTIGEGSDGVIGEVNCPTMHELQGISADERANRRKGKP